MPLWAWILFYGLVVVMLYVDLKSFGRKGQHEVSIREALSMTVVWITVSLVFCAGIWFFYPVAPQEKAMEFLPLRVPDAFHVLRYPKEVSA